MKASGQVFAVSVLWAALGCHRATDTSNDGVGEILNDRTHISTPAPAFSIVEGASIRDSGLSAMVGKLASLVLADEFELPDPDAIQAGTHTRGGGVDDGGGAVVVQGSQLFVAPPKAAGRVMPAGKWTPMDPIGAIPLAGQSWLVIDRTMSPKVFKRVHDVLTFSRSIPIAASPDSMSPDSVCASGKLLFVRAWAPSDGLTIRSYELNGKLVKAFSPGYQFGTNFVRSQLSKGLIGCLAESGTVITAESSFPHVSAYTTSGDQMWSTEIDGMRLPTQVRTKTRQGNEGVLNKKGPVFDLPLNLVAVHNQFVLYQFLRVTRPTQQDVPLVTLRSVLIDAKSGSGAFVPTELPYVLKSSAAGLVGVRRSKPNASGALALVNLRFVR